ncbi:MAG: hypothetical protein Q9196_003086 [Gyalolechia fulgens]
MPAKSFPLTKSLRHHVDPRTTPYSIRTQFRTDIWVLPKRDPTPTPPMSPCTKEMHEGSIGEDTAQALARLRELGHGTENEQQKEEAGTGVEDEEKGDEEK